MTRFDHLLIALRWPDDLVAELVDRIPARTVTVCAPGDPAAISTALTTADAFISTFAPDRRTLDAPHLRWFHLDRAGIDAHAPRELFVGRTITSSAGRSAPALADQALALALAVNARLPLIETLQRRRLWDPTPVRGRSALTGSTAVVIGCGYTGAEVAARLAALDVRTVGIARTPRTNPHPFDRIVASPDRRALHDELGAARLVIVAAGLNDATHHLIDRDALAALPAGAVVVNVARGELIDQCALVDALRSGHLGGAGLLVTDPEPLPPWSKLWRARNTIVVPHTVPAMPDRDQRSLEIIASIADDLQAGRVPDRALTVADAYTTAPRRSRIERVATTAWLATVGRTIRSNR